MICGIAVVLVMTPFDVLSTRLYNQGNYVLLLMIFVDIETFWFCDVAS